MTIEIKMKSPRSKTALKQNKRKKKAKKGPKNITQGDQYSSWLQRMLDIKESQWHDDEYDAGKDW